MFARAIIASAFCCLFTGIIAAQAPVIYTGGTVSAASLFPLGAPNYGASPGSIVSIFGTNLAISTAAATTIPLPTILNGTSVTIGGIATPLFYVGKGQINAQVPYGVTAGSQAVVVTTAAGASASGAIPIRATQPAIFAVNQNGMGQASVQNAIVNGTSVSYVNNGATTAVMQGNLLIVYGTGGGALATGPASGAACGTQQFSGSYSATIGGVAASVQYAGCSPGFVGLDQWNIVIPATIPAGCFLPLQVTVGGVVSNVVTVAVSAAGNCSSEITGAPSFPQGQAYATFSMGRVVYSVPGQSGTITSSQFNGFINLLTASSTPATGGLPPAGGGCLTEIYGNSSRGSFPSVGFPTYSSATALDAGAVTVTAPNGVISTPAVVSMGASAINASQSANGLTIAPGNWIVTGPGGKNVGAFTATAAASPLFTTTSLGLTGSTFSASSPLTMTWTCPSPAAEVIVSISSGNSSNGLYGGSVCAAACSAGTLTVPASVLQQLPASSSGNANVYLFLYSPLTTVNFDALTGLNVAFFSFFDAAAASNLTLTP